MNVNSIKSFLNNPDNRSVIYQVVAILGFLFFCYYIVNNLFFNIEKRGITTGFDFLSASSGFEVLFSLIEFDSSHSFLRLFFVGLLNTILVSALAIIFSTIIGIIIGVGRLSDNWLISKLCTGYVELFRNIPVLLQIIFWYKIVLSALPSPRQSIALFDSVYLNLRGLYLPKFVLESNAIWILVAFILAVVAVVFLRKWAIERKDTTGEEFPLIATSIAILIALPLLVGLLIPNTLSLDTPELRGFNFRGGMSLIPEFLALLVGLSIYTATYISEAIRSGIEAIPQGQKEAAQALGLSQWTILKKIILPQALRVAIPPIINQYLNVTKNSSLATAIGYPDLVAVFAGTALNQVGQAVEIILMTMAVYLFLSISISVLLNWYNAKIALKAR